MHKFTYLGIPIEQKKEMIEKQMKGLDPPEVRGQEPEYHITRDDEEYQKEAKKKKIKKWLDDRKKEIVDAIEASDKMVTFMDPTKPGKNVSIKFEKGKSVELADDHPLVKKLRVLSVGHEQAKLHSAHVVVKHEMFKMEIGKDKSSPSAAPVKE